MKVNKWIITAAQFNTDDPVEVDVKTTVTRSPDSQAPDYDDIYYPNHRLLLLKFHHYPGRQLMEKNEHCLHHSIINHHCNQAQLCLFLKKLSHIIYQEDPLQPEFH